MRRTLGRGVALFGIVTVVWMLFPSAAGASGGGGCGRPISERAGSTVGIAQFCFNPTVVRVPVGGRVTFTNHDPFIHTVLGANGAWGSFEELGFEQSVSYVFKHRGVFPFVCTVHPGMSGAVQVGRSNEGVSAVGDPAVPVPTTPARLVGRTDTEPTSSGGAGWPVAAAAEAMLMLVLGAIVLEQRRSKSGGPTGA